MAINMDAISKTMSNLLDNNQAKQNSEEARPQSSVATPVNKKPSIPVPDIKKTPSNRKEKDPEIKNSLCIRVPASVDNQLEFVSYITRISKSSIVTEALIQYMSKWDSLYQSQQQTRQDIGLM